VEAMITQPGKTEDSILRHLTDIILDCSGELYALYRSTHKVASDALSLMTMPEASQGNLFPASGINDLGCPGFAAVTDPYGTLNYTSPYFSSHPAGCQTTPTFEDAQQRAAKAGRIQHQHLSLATAQNKPNINIFAPDFTNNEGTSLEPTSQDKTRWIDNMCTAVGIDENDQPGHCHQQPPFQHRATASCPDFNIGSRLKRCTASFTPDLTTYRPQTLEQIRHQARGNEQKDHHTSAYTENSFWYGDLTNIDGTKQVDYQTSMGNVESLSLPNPEDFDFSNWEEICH
jgi:hypothetical protein